MRKVDFTSRFIRVSWLLLAALELGIARADDDAVERALEPIAIGQPHRIEVSPARFRLLGVREKLHLVVTGFYEDGRVQDLTRVAQFASSDSSVAVCESGVVLPKGNGDTTVVIRAGGKETVASLQVVGQGESQPVLFRNDTLAALSKQGCNSGACHGSPTGKGGFRLSLRAFDAELDEYTLTREEYGRRTNPLESESSLLLLKPLMKVSHGGGLRLHARDPAYRVLRDWISEGLRIDDENAPHCVGVEALPGSNRTLVGPAHTQHLCVLATFSDGSVRDVTEFAVYSTSDTVVATVTAGGLVVGHDRGEAAVIVRFLEFIESTILTFVKEIEDYKWNEPPVNNYVDSLVHAKLKKLQYLPSDLCTDEAFLRRVYLDVIGILPTVEEAEQFLSNPSNDKRSKLIDELLERPEYAQFWTLKWGDVLRMTRGQVGDESVHKYHRWVKHALSSNMPYDEFARQLLAASGSTRNNPPANFYRTADDMNDCVETISQIFLGVRLQCAKCHNHPFERWTQDNYYGMGAFFNRIQRKQTRRPGELVVWSATTGDVTQPRTGETMKPWVPVAGIVEDVNPDDHRITFVDWLTSVDNPFFAKIEVNRIWSHLLGRGIVDPVDDFRDSNPPSIAPLLDALARDFVEHGFDRKHVIRTVVNSRTYQMSHVPNDFNRDDEKYFSRYRPRLLTAEQMLDAIGHVTGTPETFDSLPPGMKATQLPAPDIANHEFLKMFGQPERATACECERSAESNLGMAIQFLNGPLIQNKVSDRNNRFRKLVATGNTDEQIIRALNLAALSRLPTEDELHVSVEHMSARRARLESQHARIQKELDRISGSISELYAEAREELSAVKLEAVPDAIRADTKLAMDTPPEERNAVQTYLMEKLGPQIQVSDEEVSRELSEERKKELADRESRIAELKEAMLSPTDMRVAGLEDICWVLLNRNEFLFNH